jgi:hypothetical protein
MRHQSRPQAGVLNTTIFSRTTSDEKKMLGQKALEMDRTMSWIIRDALIKAGYLPEGRLTGAN